MAFKYNAGDFAVVPPSGMFCWQMTLPQVGLHNEGALAKTVAAYEFYILPFEAWVNQVRFSSSNSCIVIIPTLVCFCILPSFHYYQVAGAGSNFYLFVPMLMTDM